MTLTHAATATPLPATSPAPGQAPAPATSTRFFGYPDHLLDTTWTLRDVMRFFAIEERKARTWINAPGAPAKLRMGTERCDRWNPFQVVAWAHGADWTALTQFTAVHLAAPGPAGPPAGDDDSDLPTDPAHPAHRDESGSTGAPGVAWTEPRTEPRAARRSPRGAPGHAWRPPTPAPRPALLQKRGA